MCSICLVYWASHKNSIAGSVSIGGGYGAAGVTITDAGVISVDGTSTLAGSVSIGGGYGNTGVTITDAGVISAANNLAVDGTSTLAGRCPLELDMGL